jgi:hypothetical protein
MRVVGPGLALAAALVLAGPAAAQMRGSSASGGAGGGAGGSFVGSSGSSGSSSSSLSSSLTGSFVGGNNSFTGTPVSMQSTSIFKSNSTVGSQYGFNAYYANPLSIGMPSNSNGNASFGSPLYNTSTSAFASTRGGNLPGSARTNAPGSASFRSGSTTASTSPVFASSGTLRRAPQFTTELGPTLGPTTAGVVGPPGQLQADVQAAFAGSVPGSAMQNVQISIAEGGVVVLSGQVPSERDRRLAEAVARLTPGVTDVRNDLVPQR